MARTGSRASGKQRSPGLHVAEEWVGGRVLMPSYVMEDEPFRPELVVWLDVAHDQVVGTDMCRPGENASALAQVLATAMAAPMAGPPRKPSQIRVAHSAEADLLRAHVAKDMRVVVAPTPELDQMLEVMTASMQRDDGRATYLEDGKVSAEAMARFFVAASKLWRAAPWKLVDDSQLLRLDAKRLDAHDKAVSIIGALGESFGVLVFDSVDGYYIMQDCAEAQAAGDELDSLGVAIFSINFERGADLPETMRAEVAKHGWVVAEANAYPQIKWMQPDFLLRPLTDRDVVFATACCEALVVFFERHGAAIIAKRFDSARERIPLADLPGKPTVEITGPHPEMDSQGDYYEAQLEKELEHGRQIAAAFVANQKAAGCAESWLQAASLVSESLYTFKVNYIDGSARGWTAQLVEEYLLGFLPRKVSADAEFIELTPQVVTAFFTWAAAAGHVTNAVAQAIGKRTQAKAKQFKQEMAHSDNFGVAKSLAMSMQNAGVDFNNQDEVNRYLSHLNATPGGLDFLPLPGLPTHGQIVLGAKVGSNEACSCGSGKKFKKCCGRV